MVGWIKDIIPDAQFEGVLLIRRVEVRRKKDGVPFLSFLFSDRTGEINGNYWSPPSSQMDAFSEGEVVQVKGRGRMYMGAPELDVEWMEKASRWSPEQFVEKAPLPTDVYLKTLREYVAGVSLTPLRQLLEEALDEEKLLTAPAAKMMHHPVIGGLVEHIATLLRLADAAAKIYPEVNRDLLIAGIILHDIGKTQELDITTKVDFTTPGRLLGHIFQGCAWVLQKVAKIPNFPEDVKMKLLHIILSHHGEQELGSPVVPQTLEAILVHALDNLDAKFWAFKNQIQREKEPGSDWTGYHKLLKRFIYFDRREEESGG